MNQIISGDYSKNAILGEIQFIIYLQNLIILVFFVIVIFIFNSKFFNYLLKYSNN